MAAAALFAASARLKSERLDYQDTKIENVENSRLPCDYGKVRRPKS